MKQKKYNYLFPDQLTESQIRKIEGEMRPNCSSCYGFLNNNEKLLDVYFSDKKILEDNNITFDQIADRIETLTEKANRDMWVEYESGRDVDKVVVDNNFSVKSTYYMGVQDCPFDNYKNYKNVADSPCEYSITNRSLKRHTFRNNIFISGLHVHLIRYHHFFEGHTKYRVEPQKVIDILEIKPNISYKPEYKLEKYWRHTNGSWNNDIKTFEDLKKSYFWGEISKFVDGAQKIKLDNNNGVEIYEKNDKLFSFCPLKPLKLDKPLIVKGYFLNEIDSGCWMYEKENNYYIENN